MAAFIGAPPELVVRPGPNDSEGKGFVEHGLQLRLEHLEQKENESQRRTPPQRPFRDTSAIF